MSVGNKKNELQIFVRIVKNGIEADFSTILFLLTPFLIRVYAVVCMGRFGVSIFLGSRIDVDVSTTHQHCFIRIDCLERPACRFKTVLWIMFLLEYFEFWC